MKVTAAVRANPCSIVWLALIALTLVTFTLGGTTVTDGALPYVVLAIALVKAQLVADRFMGLRRVAGFWRPLITAYLLVLGCGIALAFAV